VYSVFANAGYGLDATVAETSVEQARRMFEVNFFGTMNAYLPALPHMLRAGEGHVLICSSSIGKLALPGSGMYCATKAAQNHIGRAMNMELRRKGVHTSTVHPVGTRTEFFDQLRKRSGNGGATFDQHAPGWMMQSAETVAGSIVRCLRRPRPEVWPTWSVLVRLGMAVGMAFPAMADLGVRRLAD
jgi:short-subunit dehydrogenase